jgi:SagB-type dehydrogenase family enzyme
VVVGNAEGVSPGVYRYVPSEHALVHTADGDFRKALWNLALKQEAVRAAPITVVIAAVTQRVAVKYGDRAQKYVEMEVGAAAQNIALQAESLGLGAVLMGAFQDDAVRRLLSLPDDHHVPAIMPVGHPLPRRTGQMSPS